MLFRSALAATAASQSTRAQRILAELRAKHPGVAVMPIVRRDPPPTSLRDLALIGDALLGA